MAVLNPDELVESRDVSGLLPLSVILRAGMVDGVCCSAAPLFF